MLTLEILSCNSKSKEIKISNEQRILTKNKKLNNGRIKDTLKYRRQIILC